MVIERAQEVAAQLAALRIEPLQEVLLQQARQQTLHGIFGFEGVEPASSRVDVERAPARAADVIERAASLERVLALAQDARPARLGEARRSRGLGRGHASSIVRARG